MQSLTTAHRAGRHGQGVTEKRVPSRPLRLHVPVAAHGNARRGRLSRARRGAAAASAVARGTTSQLRLLQEVGGDEPQREHGAAGRPARDATATLPDGAARAAPSYAQQVTPEPVTPEPITTEAHTSDDT